MTDLSKDPVAPFLPKTLVKFVQSEFRKKADPGKAQAMAAYMKTDMPFYGVQNPDRVPVYQTMRRQFPVYSMEDYRAGVMALWNLPHREEKYAAIEFASQNKKFISLAALDLYEMLIRDGAWWDLVDPIATLLISRVFQENRETMRPTIHRWSSDVDLWIRRTALIAHLKHKDRTDAKQLFGHCAALANEKEFFIRKAIGWALREYSKSAPEAVHRFLLENQSCLSGLSFREGVKHLVRTGIMQAG
jgi:3-methyladenine DNA glycosylase AlkD